MSLQKQFLSDTHNNLNNVYYGFLLAFIILLLASIGCLYTLFLDIPVQVIIIFFILFVFFAKQSIDALNSLRLLSGFILELTVNDENISIRVVSKNSQIYFSDKNISIKSIKKNNLFKKITPQESNIFEIETENKTYFISLSDSHYHELIGNLTE